MSTNDERLREAPRETVARALWEFDGYMEPWHESERALYFEKADAVLAALAGAAASPADERRAAGSMRRAADEPATPGEHLQWGKGWKVGRAEGQRRADERLREAGESMAASIRELGRPIDDTTGGRWGRSKLALDAWTAALAGVSAEAAPDDGGQS